MSSPSTREQWLTVFPALLWPALAAAKGDWRLMFPFALQLAPAVACRRRLRAGVAVVGCLRASAGGRMRRRTCCGGDGGGGAGAGGGAVGLLNLLL